MKSKQRNRKRETLFDKRIIQDRNICNNCFTRVREVLREFDDVTLPKSVRGCLEDITARVDAETAYYPSYSVSEGIVTVCSKCETKEYIEREVRNLESGESIKKTRGLEDRLREDEDVSLQGDLHRAVKERFDAPKYQFKDQLKLFNDAVGEVAVRSSGPETQ
jgi:hypothetical protein